MQASPSPGGIVTARDGNVWFTEARRGGIGRVTPSGTVTHFASGIRRGAEPAGVAAGPDGNVWFTEGGVDRVGRITPRGKVTEFAVGITRGAQPAGIAAGPDGNLWFAESGAGRIGRITPRGEVTEFAAGITPGAEPTGITAGPDGNLWFTEYGSISAHGDSPAAIGRITPTGQVTEFTSGVAGGWLAGIAAGPDGNLWFTSGFDDRIGRITPAGAVEMFSAGITGHEPYAITRGPDRTLWFTQSVGRRIGQIIPAAPDKITEFRTTPVTLSVRPLTVRAPRGHRLRLRVRVTHAAGLVAGDLTVTLTPSGARSATLRTSVTVLPDNAGSRTVTIGIEVPRRARTGHYTLRARLVDQDSATLFLARLTKPSAVRITR